MKTISVPLNKKAMQRLDFDTCIDGDLKEIELTLENYQQLWKSGIFNELNKKLDIAIDDYEDEKISLDKLQEAIDIVKTFQDKNIESIALLSELLKIALERKTAIFFFF